MNVTALLLAIAAGVAACIGVYHSIKQVGRLEGAQQQMSRVEKAERTIDAKIAKKQRAIADKPASSVLDKWSRD